jgi:predicted PurR-regulated permease PerM
MIRKNLIINREFQLKTTFSIIGIILVGFFGIISLSGAIIADNNQMIQKAISDIHSTMDKESKIFKIITDNTVAKDNGFSKKKDEAIRDHKLIKISMKHNIDLLESISRQNKLLVMGMLFVGIILSLALYIFLIRLTHRIAGPIHLLSRAIDDLLNNKKPNLRSLRKNDEFKDFYNQFSKIVELIPENPEKIKK